MWLAIFGYTAGAVVLFFIVLTYYLCIRFIRFDKPEDEISSGGGYGFSCDTADGCHIQGEILVPDESAGTAVVLSDLPIYKNLINRLLEAGIAVIRYQGRGYLESGRPCTWGIREARDLRLIYTTAANRAPEACQMIGTIGREGGAAAALLHACMDDRVQFVIGISPYADLLELVQDHLRDKGFPPFPIIQLLKLMCRILHRVDIAKASPAAEISARGGLMKVPVLLISEQDNGKIPPVEVHRTAETLKGPVYEKTLTATFDRPMSAGPEAEEFASWILEMIKQSSAS